MRISDWSSDVCSSVLDQAGRSRQTGALCWTCRRYGLRWRKPPPMPGRDLLSRGHDGGLILSASSCKPGKESPMRKLAQWLDEYSASHRKPTNKLLHWLCVPLIAFSIACALKVIHVGQGNFNAATCVGVVTLLQD